MESEEDAKDTLLDVKLKKRTFRGQPVKGGLKSVSMVRSFYPVMASPVIPPVYPGMQYTPPYGVVPNGAPMPPMHYGYGIIPGTVNAGMHLNLGVMPGDEQMATRQPHSPAGSDGGEGFNKSVRSGGEGRRLDRGSSGTSNKSQGAGAANGQSFPRENRGDRGDRNKGINSGSGSGGSGKGKGDGNAGGSSSNSSNSSSSGSGGNNNNNNNSSNSSSGGISSGNSNSNSGIGGNNSGSKQGRGKGNDSRRDASNSNSPSHGDKSQQQQQPVIEINSANFPPLHGGQGGGANEGPIPVPGYKGTFIKYTFDDIINIVKDIKEAVIPSSIRPENHPLAMTSTPNLDLLQRQRTFSIDETREQLRQGRPVQREAVIAGAVDYGSMMYGDDRDGAANAAPGSSSGGSHSATTDPSQEPKKSSGGGSWAAIASASPSESAVKATTTVVKKAATTTTSAPTKTDDKAGSSSGAGGKDGAKKSAGAGSGDKKKSDRREGGNGGGGRKEGGGGRKGEGSKVSFTTYTKACLLPHDLFLLNAMHPLF